jgi:hypothetical protein
MVLLWPEQPVHVQYDPERGQAMAEFHGAF